MVNRSRRKRTRRKSRARDGLFRWVKLLTAWYRRYVLTLFFVASGSLFTIVAVETGPETVSACRYRSFVQTEGSFLIHNSYIARHRSRSRRNRGPTTYRIRMIYGYEVDGTRYQNRNGSIMYKGFRHRNDADYFAKYFSEGDAVTVYYDPRAPHHSCLVLPNDLLDAGAVRGVVILALLLSVTGAGALGAAYEIRDALSRRATDTPSDGDQFHDTRT